MSIKCNFSSVPVLESLHFLVRLVLIRATVDKLMGTKLEQVNYNLFKGESRILSRA